MHRTPVCHPRFPRTLAKPPGTATIATEPCPQSPCPPRPFLSVSHEKGPPPPTIRETLKTENAVSQRQRCPSHPHLFTEPEKTQQTFPYFFFYYTQHLSRF